MRSYILVTEFLDGALVAAPYSSAQQALDGIASWLHAPGTTSKSLRGFVVVGPTLRVVHVRHNGQIAHAGDRNLVALWRAGDREVIA